MRERGAILGSTQFPFVFDTSDKSKNQKKSVMRLGAGLIMSQSIKLRAVFFFAIFGGTDSHVTLEPQCLKLEISHLMDAEEN
jgi:hypothetical protein